MCGIAGFLRPAGLERGADETLRAMTDAIRHRGPDDSGAWLDADAGVALGHRRLSIIDLSPLGHQPMHSASARWVVVFNGEIYNFRALRAELEAAGTVFRGHSDTEVLLGAVERWGVEGALERFNGMFAFALFDRERRELHLARDRAGEKPLYYGAFGQTLLFGSELKALRAHPAFRSDVDRDALAGYLRYAYVPGPASIYQGVQKLPPGTVATFRAGALDAAPRPYWSLRQAAEAGVARPFAGTDAEAVDRLDALLGDATALRMEADVPLGAFLSGGVDSSTVVALMQARSARPVRTFTIGFNEGMFNEAEHAAAVARHLGTDHTELYVTPREAMEVIPRLPALYDEPFADPSQIPTFLVSELARRHVTVSLSGDAGDELFGGYNRYFWGRRLWQGMGRVPHGVRRAAAAALRVPGVRGWNAVARVLGPLAPGTGGKTLGDRVVQGSEVLGARDPDAMYHWLVSHWKHPARMVRGGSERATAHTDRDTWARLDDFTDRMMYLDAVTYLPDDILVKVDRASMGVSLESRVPLLDPRVIEFAWSVPMGMKIRDGRGKWLLREVLYRYVPRALIDRPKMGFGVPVGEWLRGPLRGWAEDLLAESRLREDGYLDPAPVRERWLDHLSGRNNWEYHLWDVLMFQAWLREGGARSEPAPRPQALAVAG